MRERNWKICRTSDHKNYNGSQLKAVPQTQHSKCFVLFNEMVSEILPQEETEEKLRRTKFIILTGPRDRRCGTWGAT